MPIVTIQVTKKGSGPSRSSVTTEEKAALIAGVRAVCGCVES
jgi:4-oxalocrotonate tautomerase